MEDVKDAFQEEFYFMGDVKYSFREELKSGGISYKLTL
jgi:hypothetical protein